MESWPRFMRRRVISGVGFVEAARWREVLEALEKSGLRRRDG